MIFVANVCGQTVVKDADSGLPVMLASVYDDEGTLLGLTDEEGLLPKLGGSRSLRITHVAYKPLQCDVGRLPKELKMEPVEMNVGEVVIDKPKSYCMKLTGFFRNLELNNDTTGRQKKLSWGKVPVLLHEYGIKSFYVFLDGNKVTREFLRGLVVDVKHKELPVFSPDLERMPYITKLKEGGKYEFRGDDLSCEIYSLADGKKHGQVVADTVRQIIRCDFSAILKDSVRSGHVMFVPYTVSNDSYSAVYKMSPYGNLSQSNLVVHKESSKITLKVFGVLFDYWMQGEFYPFDVQFLTKDEYKADIKQWKQDLKEGRIWRAKDIEECGSKLGVPPLPEEVSEMIERSKRLVKEYESKEKK